MNNIINDVTFFFFFFFFFFTSYIKNNLKYKSKTLKLRQIFAPPSSYLDTTVELMRGLSLSS